MRKNKNKGFSMVELVVVIAIMVVLLAILVPSVVRYTEDSRMQRDESAMDEVCNAAQLALADSNTFDEVFSYAIPNNYITYTDSSGVYGAKYTDEEFWAPDGSGAGVTITFNPDENGTYYLADGIVNDMTFGNGSVASARVNDDVQQCYLEEMGKNSLLYNNLKKAVGETISEKSATYKNSSYTMFIKYDLVNGVYRPDIYGSFNGTNLSEASPASLGSGTESYTPENEAITTIPGGTTTPNYTSSDLSGGGSVSGSSGWNNALGTPKLKGGGTFNQATDTEPLVFTRAGRTDPIIGIKVNGTLLESTDYTLEDNSKTVKLNVNYLMGLNLGNFSLSVVTAENTVSAPFTVKYLPKDTETVIYDDKNANTNITYVDFTVTAENRHKVGYTGVENEKLAIPAVFFDAEDNKWYKVTSIGNYAFKYCDSLTSIIIPDSVTSIGGSAFEFCSNLTSIVIPDSVISIEHSAFKYCTSLTSITIPDGVTSIGNHTFSGCSSLTSVTIPDSVTSFGKYAFEFCSSLTSIEIPDGVTSIEHSAFKDCKNLTSIVIPDNVTSIGGAAFSGCSSLTSIEISNSVTSIGNSTFINCRNLASIEIPDSVTSIGSHVFYNCNSLTSIVIPDSVTSIGSHVFYNCNSLTSIVIPNGVPSIGSYAFLDCKALTSITIPDSVTTIGEWAFYNCSSLISITFRGTMEQWNAITKGAEWNSYTGNHTIHCTDGDIPKS